MIYKKFFSFMCDITSMSSELNALYKHIHSFAPLKFTPTTLWLLFGHQAAFLHIWLEVKQRSYRFNCHVVLGFSVFLTAVSEEEE